MSDEFDRNREKDIEEFLDRFDQISNEFDHKKTREQRDETVSHGPKEEGSHAEPPNTSLPVGRLDRLNESKTKRTRNRSDKQDNNPGMDMARAQNTKKRRKYRFHPKRLILTILILMIVVGAAGGVWAFSVVRNTPQIDADNIYSMLSENSILYDDQGNEVESIFAGGSGRRTNLDYTEMPDTLINAFVAIEDKTFWEHNGFNFVRIFGAIFDGLTSGDRISGTSTITQQLARNLYLEDTKSLRSLDRKIKEAYYAIQLERQLSKEQIIEAYLNTIYLGSGANGVQAAAQTYFSKDVGELTVAECAVLASIPQSPNKFSPIKRLDNADITTPESLDFLYRGDTFSIWYQDAFKDRQLMTLKFMKDQSYIDDSTYEAAVAEDIRAEISPNIDVSAEISSYFADYVVNQVVEDLMYEFNLEEDEAKNMIYNGGLRIYSTLNVDMQKIADTEFKKKENFPGVTGLNKDKAGNARDADGKILLYAYSNLFDEDGNFHLSSDEYQMNEDGSMTIFKGKRLNIYKTEVNGEVDYSLEFKGMYTVEDGTFYSISSGFILIPSEYKSRDEDGNLILSDAFFTDRSQFEVRDNEVLISKDNYQLNEKVIQPQAAMIIMDYKTGGIKAMAGGRSITGKLLFNRSLSTRQPGSAIKPMAVYGPALQRTVDMVNNGTITEGETLWTAASVIDDAPYVVDGKLWPKNWYDGYRGLYSLRQAVEQSVNVCSVKVFTDIGPETSLAFLKKLGVTSVVEEGNVNDMNAAALALGGMTKGVSPLEMTAGFSTFANQGIYTEPISYTSVTNKKGEILLERVAEKRTVMDRGVAFVMTDILHSTVTNGIAKAAGIGSHPVAGKTGTTTDNYDAWFVGMTPLYSAAVWIGNDINLELSQGSVAAARLWSRIMKQVHVGLPSANFPTAENVESVTIDSMSGKLPSELSALDPRGTVHSEYFVTGTAPTTTDDVHVSVTICSETGLLATPSCPHPVTKVMVKRPDGSVISYGNAVVGDIAYNAPTHYCNLHNPDPSSYPIDPNQTVTPYNGSGGGTDVTTNPDGTENDIPITDNRSVIDSNPQNRPNWLN